MSRPRVLLWAPTLYESGFKQHHVDGDALAAQAALRAGGYDSVLLDAYYRGRPAVALAAALDGADGRFDVVVAHLFTSDAYGPRLAGIAAELQVARRDYHVVVIGFGPLAVSAAADLTAAGAVDHIVAGPALRPATRPVASLMARLEQHLREHVPLDVLAAEDLPYTADAVVSVPASRGCRSRCTFCAYNADLPGGGWQELSIRAVVADIAYLHRITGATTFAFTDSDFGGTREHCRRRAIELRDMVRAAGLAGAVTFAISVRPESLTEDTVGVLAQAGVDTALVGVESFDSDTLHRVYGKRQDLPHLARIAEAADAAGITVIGSYILWHPWQTLTGLRREVDALDGFGRHRVPQFMARSRLRVIPGTVIERRIRAEGLLDEAPFHRGFRIADAAAAALHDDLRGWYTTHAQPVIAGLHEQQTDAFATLGALKAAEWCWFTEQVAARAEAAARA